MTTKQDNVRLGTMQRMWSMGRKGPIDYSKRASVVYLWGQGHEKMWLSNSGHSDLEHYDVPSDDIDVIKVHGRNVYIGGKHRGTYAGRVASVLTNNFTRAELNAVRHLYIESEPRAATMHKAAGMHEGYNVPLIKGNKTVRASRIRVSRKHHDSNAVLTHEVIHAVRSAQGRHTRDVDKEEKETDLETTARVGKRDFPGYYYYAKDPTAAMAFDTDLMTADTTHGKLKGKAAIERTQKRYNKSKIKDVHFSPAENIDRYFVIKTANGTKTDVHMRFLKTSNLNTIKAGFKTRYGKDVQIWEWRDGKKVKVATTSKKRTGKKATKRKTI